MVAICKETCILLSVKKFLFINEVSKVAKVAKFFAYFNFLSEKKSNIYKKNTYKNGYLDTFYENLLFLLYFLGIHSVSIWYPFCFFGYYCLLPPSTQQGGSSCHACLLLHCLVLYCLLLLHVHALVLRCNIYGSVISFYFYCFCLDTPFFHFNFYCLFCGSTAYSCGIK